MPIGQKSGNLSYAPRTYIIDSIQDWNQRWNLDNTTIGGFSAE